MRNAIVFNLKRKAYRHNKHYYIVATNWSYVKKGMSLEPIPFLLVFANTTKYLLLKQVLQLLLHFYFCKGFNNITNLNIVEIYK